MSSKTMTRAAQILVAQRRRVVGDRQRDPSSAHQHVVLDVQRFAALPDRAQWALGVDQVTVLATKTKVFVGGAPMRSGGVASREPSRGGVGKRDHAADVGRDHSFGHVVGDGEEELA